MIALLVALEQEVSGLRRRLALTPEPARLPCPAYGGEYVGHSLLLALTGAGRQRAEAACNAILARYPVTAVLSLGFSGALDGRAQVGDLVLASELMGITGTNGHDVGPMVIRSDQQILRTAVEALRATPLRVLVGPTVTAPGIIATPVEKQDLGRQTGAIAVDMESYWVARAVVDRGLPFLALRAISDAQTDPLPPLDEVLDEDGIPSTRRLAAYLCREPGNLRALLKLARNAGRARRALIRGGTATLAAL